MKLKGILIYILMMPTLTWAADTNIVVHDSRSSFLLWATIIFIFALLGRYLANRLNQPGVLGELIIGIILSNVGYYFGSQLLIIIREGSAITPIISYILNGHSLTEAINSSIPNPFYAKQVYAALNSGDGSSYLQITALLDIFSRYGIIFLLFMVGLESSFEELKHTGREALQVALIGVIAPMILGFFAIQWIDSTISYKANLFVAAALSATSIGITARVLAEMKKLHTPEAKTILSAAIFDDVLGLILLAIVSSLVVNSEVTLFMIMNVIVYTLLFFVISLAVGPWFLRKLIACCQSFEPNETKLFVSFIFIVLIAWLATIFNLSSIVGAFVAGMIINDSFFNKNESETKVFSIKALIFPLEALLAPLFFILIGMQVKLETLFDLQVIITAIFLILAAIIGKLVSGLGASSRHDRWLIGIGMLPRGEVGLIFASIGKTLGVISDQLFSAIVLMILVTTLMAPPLLKIRYQRKNMRKK